MTDERELFSRYRVSGDKELRNEIAERYLYIASVLAKKFVGRGVEYDDLYQVASLALLKGIDRFDETKGIKFSTFITPTITGEIKNYFRDHSRLIHLPRRVAELRICIGKAAEELFAETGRSPSAREIARRLGVSEEEIVRAQEAGGVVSLDSPAEDGEGSYYEVLPSERDDFEKLENRDAVASALGELSEQERRLVRLRFGDELSQTETAKRLGVSQMYVSRLERKVLDRMRESLGKGV